MKRLADNCADAKKAGNDEQSLEAKKPRRIWWRSECADEQQQSSDCNSGCENEDTLHAKTSACEAVCSPSENQWRKYRATENEEDGS